MCLDFKRGFLRVCVCIFKADFQGERQGFVNESEFECMRGVRGGGAQERK